MSADVNQTPLIFDPIKEPRFFSDPYPLYRHLRENDPVQRNPFFDGWSLSRYKDVVAILKDPRYSCDERKSKRYPRLRQQMEEAGVSLEQENRQRSMVRMDPPDHRRLRGLVNKAFTPRAVQRLAPRIEAIASDLLDKAADRGEMDFMRDFAGPLPVIVIAEMLGIPAEDHGRFKQWSDDAISSLGVASAEDRRRTKKASEELMAYLREIADQRRKQPREDLITGLLQAEEQGDRLTWDEFFSTVFLLLVAGNETSTNMLGNGLLALLRQPEQFALLRARPELAESAVEEILRWNCPVVLTTRFPKEDIAFGDALFKKGETVVCLFASANHDPEMFPQPERFDIARAENKHLAFGLGIHFCLGAPLARLEGRIAFNLLAQRFSNMKLATDELQWVRNTAIRGLKALPIAF